MYVVSVVFPFQLPFSTSLSNFSFQRNMSSSFTHSPGYQRGGVSVYTWLEHHWRPSDWMLEWDPMVDMSGVSPDLNDITYDGGKYTVHDSAIIFRHFRPLKDGQDGGYMADPVAIARYNNAMETAITRPNWQPPGVLNVAGGDVVIPIGQPCWSKETTKIVLRQSARMWVSGGTNTAEMKDENVLVMYYSALQSMVYAASITEDKAKQSWLFTALFHLTRSFALIAREEPLFQKITTAMVMTPGVDDMLQKALAHVFHPRAVWDKETRLDMLAIVLRRNMRRGAKLVGMAPGSFAVFILAPLLRGLAMNPLEPVAPETLVARYNAGMQKLLEAFVARASSDLARMETNALVALTTAIGAPLTAEQSCKLLRFAATEKRMSIQPPWVSWGVLPAPPALEPSVTTAAYSVSGRPHATFHANIRPSSATTFRVLGFKGVNWSAVQFATPGQYTIVAHDLGIAQQGEGNTRGQELVANWRITCGHDILPKYLPGYSSAGMEHTSTLGYSGRMTWDYVKKTPIPFGTTFTLVVTKDDIAIHVGGKTLWSAHMMEPPALLAFKNIWLDVTYDPLLPPVSEPEPVPVPEAVKPTPIKVDLTTAAQRGPVNYAAAARGTLRRTDLDLPPSALIAKLREAATSFS
jgi:hypothetical protein